MDAGRSDLLQLFQRQQVVLSVVSAIAAGLDAAVLGEHPLAKVHTYGKSARAGRKMGHVTVVADSAEHALAEAQGASAVLLRG